MSTLASRLRSWIRRTLGRLQLESEMEAEIRFHVDAYTEDLVRKGVPRAEAVRRVLRPERPGRRRSRGAKWTSLQAPKLSWLSTSAAA